MTKKKRRYLYSTVRKGKVKIKSTKQHKLLHARDLPHTHVYRATAKNGSTYFLHIRWHSKGARMEKTEHPQLTWEEAEHIYKQHKKAKK